MLDFKVIRAGFFDTAKVTKAVGRMRKKQLSKAGAFVRTRSRSSIRRRKKSSLPGQPPSAHGGEIKLIFFAYDARTESVVVGPVLFAAARGPRQGMRLLEEGGDAVYRDGKGRPRKAHYRGNPFMLPALRAEMPKFAGLFKGTLGG